MKRSQQASYLMCRTVLLLRNNSVNPVLYEINAFPEGYATESIGLND